MKLTAIYPSRHHFLVVSAFLLILFSSCNTPRYVYSPAAENVPLLTEKGDSKLGGLISTNISGTKTIDGKTFEGHSNGIDLHGAYAITNKFAVQANYFSRTEKNGGDYSSASDSSVLRYKRHLTELGAGYYTRINQEGSLIFQVFAGIGLGKFSFTDDGRDASGTPTKNFHESGITKFYIQPAVMFQHKKRTSVCLSSRFSIINYRNIKTDYSEQLLQVYELSELGDGAVVFWEPAFINAIGFTKLPIRFEYQAGLSVLMSRRFIDARALNFSLGLHCDINRLLKKNGASKKD